MILFNLKNENQDIILTLSELSGEAEFNLNLNSPYDSIDITLTGDTSLNPTRYNHYIIPTSLILGLSKDVIYQYSVTDSNDNKIESGTAKIIDDTPEQKIVYTKGDEEIIIYKR